MARRFAAGEFRVRRSAAWRRLVAVAVLLAACGEDPAPPLPPRQSAEPVAAAPSAESRRAPPAAVGTIAGRVLRDRERQAPEAGIDVTLRREGAAPRTTTTDRWGEFEFAGISPGAPHDLRVAAEGCAEVRFPAVTVLPAERRDVGALILDPPRSIDVRVVDERGAPIGGATVEVHVESGSRLDSTSDGTLAGAPVPAATLTTDASGRASHPAAPSETYTLAARAPGRARVADADLYFLRKSDAPLEATLVLPPARRLASRVLTLDGQGVAGTVVLVRRRPRVVDSHHGTRADGPALWQRTLTDAEGRYAFDALSPGASEILVGPRTAFPRFAAFVDVGSVDVADLELPATASASGRVTDAETGAPIAGAAVRITSGRVPVTASATTDADGLWRIDGLSATEAEIVFRPPPGWTGRARVWLGGALRPGEVRTADATFRRAATVEGRVVCDGVPVAGSEVRVGTLEPSGDRWAFQTEGRTDADGVFCIDDVLPGTAVVFAPPPDLDPYESYSRWSDWSGRVLKDAALRARESFEVRADGRTTRDLVVERLAPDDETSDERMERQGRTMFAGTRVVVVRGRVTTEDGLPLDAAKVVADHGRVSARQLQLAEVVSQDGRYAVPCRVSAGENTVSVLALDERHEAATAEDVDIPDGASEVTVDLVLPARPLLRGRVTCEGSPVAGARVSTREGLVARSGLDGTFEIRVGERHDRIGVEVRGFVRRLFPRPEAAGTDFVDFDVLRAKAIEGRVEDAAGLPVPGVLVTPLEEDGDVVEPYRDWWISPDPALPVTDGEGRFRIDELPPGAFRLGLSSPPGAVRPVAASRSEPVESGTLDVRLVAEPARRIAGTVTRRDGTPLFDARLTLVALGEGVKLRRDESARSTDGRGRFEFPHLPTGSFRVELRPPWGSECVPPPPRTVDSGTDDVAFVLDPAEVIEGVVVTASGVPFERCRIQGTRLDAPAAGAPPWPWDFDVWSDEGARFRLVVPPGSRFRLAFVSPTDGALLRGGDDVAAGTKGLRLLADAGLAVAGRVVDADGAAVRRAELELRTADGGRRHRRSREDGTFAFTGLGPGDGTLTVHADPLVPVRLPVTASASGEVLVVLRPGLTISGTLLDAAGKPPGRWILRALRPSEPDADLRRARPDRRGRFEMTGLDPGEWRIEAIVEGCGGIEATAPVGTVAAGTRDLVLRLPE